MKTTSLKRSKKGNGTTRHLAVAGVSVCVLLALIQWIFPSVLFRVAYVVSVPFAATRNFIGGEFSSLGTYLSSKESLAAQNTELENDLSTVDVKLLSMEALQTQNQELENMVAAKEGNKAAKTASAVFAAVLDRPPFSPYDTLIISSGSQNGITLGNPVFADDGTPLGAIENVFPSSAKVLLFSSPNVSTTVVVGNKKFETIARGYGGGNFGFKVPVGSEPTIGDSVYIPEFSPAAIGIVKNVLAAPTDTFANVLFSLPENISEISYVTVDTSSHFQINIAADEATTTPQ